MFLCKKDDASESREIDEDEDNDEGSGFEVYGVISAKCNPLQSAKECYENHMLYVTKEEHEWVGLGTKIVLSKSLVAVPAYSELEISLDLRGYEDDGFIVQGTACFELGNDSGGSEDIQGVNGFYVRVHVTWREPSLLNKQWCVEDIIEGFRSMPHRPQSYASHGWCTIFNRSKNDAYFLSRGCNLLPLEGPRRALTPGMMFCMAVDLSDVNGHVNIKGFANSSVGIDERQKPWYDRRLISVVGIPNEKSFAAIHYTLFAFAVPAILTVRLIFKCRSSAHVKIYGDITASYDKISYSTTYDKEFFRRVLFTRKQTP